MSAKPCSRLWQVEAVFDGVLSRADAASFERHVATCPDCSAERAALAQLTSVAQRLPSAQVTPLRRRALHHELLRRANELSVGAARSRFARLRVALPIAACLLCVLGLVFVRFPWASSVTGSKAAPGFELVAAPNSRWRVVNPGSSLRLALELGSLTVSVRKLERNQNFTVKLPDGELEVRGTRFRVECDVRHTRRVTVEEGRVALRLAGQAEVSLGAGQSWPAQTAHAPTAALAAPAPSSGAVPPPGLAPSSAGAEVALDSGRQPTPKVAQRMARAFAPAPSNAARQESSPSAPARSHAARRTEAASRAVGGAAGEGAAAPAAAAHDFAEAMAAFSRGDFGTAERLFRLFEARYPGNPHVEDVLFLRALGRSRRGDPSGARVLAHEYLRRYPGGFRALEAREMAREPPPRAGHGANPGLVTFP